MSPEPDPSAVDVQAEEQEWAAAIDFDMPDLSEPLPLPEVEEISLDGTVLPDDWATDTSPQRVAQPPPGAGNDAPSPVLAEVDTQGSPVQEGAASASGPRPHPLDAVLPEAAHPAIDSDSATFVPPPVGLVTEESALPPELPSLAEVEPVPAPPPREDTDEPAPRRPFSDSLITNDSFEE